MSDKKWIGWMDSHAHLTSDSLFFKIEEYLQNSLKSGCHGIVNICTDSLTLNRGIDLKKKNPWIYLSAATTPHDVDLEGESFFPEVVEAIRQGQLHAIGETGLDYHYEHSSRKQQIAIFIRYLQLARETHLPLVIHCRGAFPDFFKFLDEEYRENGRWGSGVLHCFTGTQDDAERLVAEGWKISISGIVTFKKSIELQEIVKKIPLDSLILETDSPFLAPNPFRGQLNQPSFLIHTLLKVAELKNISPDEVISVTTKNIRDLFSLKGIEEAKSA